MAVSIKSVCISNRSGYFATRLIAMAEALRSQSAWSWRKVSKSAKTASNHSLGLSAFNSRFNFKEGNYEFADLYIRYMSTIKTAATIMIILNIFLSSAFSSLFEGWLWCFDMMGYFSARYKHYPEIQTIKWWIFFKWIQRQCRIKSATLSSVRTSFHWSFWVR